MISDTFLSLFVYTFVYSSNQFIYFVYLITFLQT